MPAGAGSTRYRAGAISRRGAQCCLALSQTRSGPRRGGRGPVAGGALNGPVPDPRRIARLGSTGSLGTPAIQVVRAAGARFRIAAIAAGG
ncbi:MAG: hypothetical protein LBQ06_03435, partial [Frankiaceae bacterium]|nr:hypothetical protein [Frankiaceae bacterium]